MAVSFILFTVQIEVWSGPQREKQRGHHNGYSGGLLFLTYSLITLINNFLVNYSLVQDQINRSYLNGVSQSSFIFYLICALVACGSDFSTPCDSRQVLCLSSKPRLFFPFLHIITTSTYICFTFGLLLIRPIWPNHISFHLLMLCIIGSTLHHSCTALFLIQTLLVSLYLLYFLFKSTQVLFTYQSLIILFTFVFSRFLYTIQQVLF